MKTLPAACSTKVKYEFFILSVIEIVFLCTKFFCFYECVDKRSAYAEIRLVAAKQHFDGSVASRIGSEIPQVVSAKSCIMTSEIPHKEEMDKKSISEAQIIHERHENSVLAIDNQFPQQWLVARSQSVDLCSLISLCSKVFAIKTEPKLSVISLSTCY
jgi:hypothetical protein